MNEKFLDNWKQAKRYEEDGHNFYLASNFFNAAESHKHAASFFKKALESLDEKEVETRKTTWGNYHIELVNYYHSLATDYFYKGDKQKALEQFRKAIREQQDIIDEYEKMKENKDISRELHLLKTTLHLLLAYENISLAQLAFFSENYHEAVEFFKTAELHSNLECEFISDVGDLQRLKRARARSHYIKGQIFRSEALEEMKNGNVKEAKEKYLRAANAFDDASKLYPKWEEYRELSEKSRKMGLIIKE